MKKIKDFDSKKLVAALKYDIEKNGIDEYPTICDYLWNGYHYPIIGIDISWNCGQSLYHIWTEEYEYDCEGKDATYKAEVIARYCEDGAFAYLDFDEELLDDDYISTFNDFIDNINRYILDFSIASCFDMGDSNKAFNDAKKYLDECCGAGRHNSSAVIDKWAKKYPSEALKEWRKMGGNIRTFVGQESDITTYTKLMCDVFGWN